MRDHSHILAVFLAFSVFFMHTELTLANSSVAGELAGQTGAEAISQSQPSLQTPAPSISTELLLHKIENAFRGTSYARMRILLTPSILKNSHTTSNS